MDAFLYINRQRIYTLEALKACVLQSDAIITDTELFNELVDKLVDKQIYKFLCGIGEIELAERIEQIKLGNSDSEMMRQLVTIITGTEPIVDFDFRSCLEVVETTVKGNKAVFKLRVLKRVNEKLFEVSVIQPALLEEVLRKKSIQDQMRQGIVGLKSKIDEVKGKSEGIAMSMVLVALSYALGKVSFEKLDFNLMLQVLKSMRFKSIDLSQCKQNDIIEFETDINSDYGVWFFIGKEKVGEISAETIAYNSYCESYGSSTYYDADRIKVISENAKKGWSRFQDLLGDVYRYGYCVDKSYKEAFSWYTKSAEKGCASAQCSLGEMYLYGKGVDIDYTKALKWFQKSSDQGNAMGQCRLGLMYEKGKGGIDVDLSKALDFYTMSAAQNNPFGQCLLGRLYEKGSGGVIKDINRALELYLKSAMQDDAMGQICLGVLVENNLSFDKNLETVAVPVEIRSKYALISDLFNKVIYRGGSGDFVFDDNELINSLSNLYRYAGNNMDAWEKYNWNKDGEVVKLEDYFPGAAFGSAYCLFMLGMISKSDSERVRLFEKAALKGGYFAAGASIIMGYICENGNGVRKNQSLAESYYGSAIRFFGKKVVERNIREIKEDIEKNDRFWDSWYR